MQALSSLILFLVSEGTSWILSYHAAISLIHHQHMREKERNGVREE